MATHGTPYRYRAGCRCASCKQAHAAKVRSDRGKRMARGSTPATHGSVTYRNYGCRCQACSTANSEYLQQYRHDPARADQLRDDERVYKAARQRASLATAIRYGQQWTGPEMELVSRDDLTFAEMATMLGRSVAAVGSKRRRILRGEPVAVRLAGRRRT